MSDANLSVFKRALVDAVLEEFPPPEPDYRDQNSLWIDGVNKCIYRKQHPGCIQHSFLSRERMVKRIRSLQQQGYTLK